VELVQGSQEWHLWRLQGIGGSDAATILGQNPYHTAAALMAERREAFPASAERSDAAGSSPSRRRAWYCAAAGEVVTPSARSARLPWLRASLDGMSADGRSWKSSAGRPHISHASQRPPEKQRRNCTRGDLRGMIDFVSTSRRIHRSRYGGTG
jgi:hypothetical protein